MNDRLLRILEAVQEKYLHAPRFVDVHARQEYIAGLRTKVDATSEDDVIREDIVGLLPPRAVHEAVNAWAYREAEFVEPTDETLPATEISTIGWYDRADEATVSVGPVVDPGEYDGFDPIEDRALPPEMRWNNADHRTAMEEAIRIQGLEPGQWIELDWPPVGHLWSEGSVHEGVIDQMAIWKFTTTMRIHEIAFDDYGREFFREDYAEPGFEVAAIEQDPREIIIGPPGEGENW